MKAVYREVRKLSIETAEKSETSELLIALGSVPMLLLFIGALPEPTQGSWVLRLSDYGLLTLYLSNFVHSSIPHLSNNILAYLLIMTFLFPLGVLADRKRELFWSSLAFLIIVPFIISLASVEALAGTAVETVVGFSGVDAAFAGTLPLFIGFFIQEKFCKTVQPSVFASGLTAVELGVVLFVAGLRGPVLYLMIVLGVGVTAWVLLHLFRNGDVENFRHVSFTVYATIVFIAIPVVLIVNVDAGTNVYGHLAGLVAGFLLPVVPLQMQELLREIPRM